MFDVILLKYPEGFAREHWQQLPELVDHEGIGYSLRAGPRQPLPTDREWDPVAVYAPEELTEEEFQELYQRNRGIVPELDLKY
ncbi:hypothetical protein OK348_12785 [Flavobacterium sp. MXW15]|uniref:Uncharacterized protein n=1 Tax=Xanthomonas chitinilytica TaxID=2989819 RepID=A0ABT3JWK0_9XANT|nr:hypothetical protein [Xanthomonas sp. H13-6]MCW4455661.1 hypothetical protein [Flavobacterium sp. MXW15]MCW4472853.1 hypothetical protein [Xanthomonas sp. H13-6]